MSSARDRFLRKFDQMSDGQIWSYAFGRNKGSLASLLQRTLKMNGNLTNVLDIARENGLATARAYLMSMRKDELASWFVSEVVEG